MCNKYIKILNASSVLNACKPYFCMQREFKDNISRSQIILNNTI